MRRIVALLLASAALGALTYLPRERSAAPMAAVPAAIEQVPGTAVSSDLDRAIAAYERRVREHTDALDWRFLGTLYLQRARTTGDASAYARAEAALGRALELFPTDVEARTTLATVRHATHDFAGALALATTVLAEHPSTFAALAVASDARLELGEYDEAARGYAILADVYPDAAPVLARLARLAFLRGDVERARDLGARAEAAARAEGAFGHGLAWYRHLRAQLAFEEGDYDAAVALERSALDAAPSSHVSLAGLGRALAARGDIDGAAAAYERAAAIAPQPEHLAALGDLLLLRGDPSLAERQYAAVEAIASLAGVDRRLYDRQLALFLADHGRSPDEAVAIARASLAARPDVYGHDVLAWALHRAGRHAEAREASDRARALGTRDARLLYHAGMISLALGETERARGELRDALALSPAFDPLGARAARDALASLRTASPGGRIGQAHPLGNFTINHYLGVVVRPEMVLLDYVLDHAEIPAFQERPRIEADPARACRDLIPGLEVLVDGRAVALSATSVALAFPPGQGGLDTLRLECGYQAALGVGAASRALLVADRNHAERIGWREIVARGEGVQLESALPRASVSARLTAYPNELFSSPLDVRSGEARVETSTREPLPIALPARDDALGVFLAMLVAIGLGAFHALTPGHGKTVMAAYLVGTGGTRRHALGLGLAVALSHTVGVLALGALTLAGTAVIAPERVYPYLSAVSAALITALGAWMVASRARHAREHRHGLAHAHGETAALGWRSLAALGLAGGVVPSASALVLLLGAISLHRAELGVILVLTFGAGMAAVLVTIGQALVAARGLAERVFAYNARLVRILALAPTVAAFLVLLLGIGMSATSLAALL